jgi:hypothetical protein
VLLQESSCIQLLRCPVQSHNIDGAVLISLALAFAGGPLGDNLSEYEFFTRAIRKLRKPPYKGIHSVYSGFNRAFRQYFDKDPVEATTRLAGEGKIVTRPVKGGVILYLPDEAPTPRQSEDALSRILNDDPADAGLEILGPAESEDDR